MTSFTEDMRGAAWSPPAARWSGRSRRRPASPMLHVSPSEPVLVATRLRLADRETMAIETLHVRKSLVPRLTAADLEAGSFYELPSREYGIELVGGMQTIEPTVTNEEESSGPRLAPHSPAFVFERVTRSQSGDIVEFVRSVYRGDRYRLVTELRRGRTGLSSPIAPTTATTGGTHGLDRRSGYV